MSKEIWKDVKGFEGEYQVSNMGNMRHIKPVSVYKNNVVFIGRRKGVSLPQIMMETFKGIPHGSSTIYHKNGDSHDNRLENLTCYFVIPKNKPTLFDKVLKFFGRN